MCMFSCKDDRPAMQQITDLFQKHYCLGNPQHLFVSHFMIAEKDRVNPNFPEDRVLIGIGENGKVRFSSLSGAEYEGLDHRHGTILSDLQVFTLIQAEIDQCDGRCDLYVAAEFDGQGWWQWAVFYNDKGEVTYKTKRYIGKTLPALD